MAELVSELKEEILRKRKLHQELVPSNKKYVKRGEIEREKIKLLSSVTQKKDQAVTSTSQNAEDIKREEEEEATKQVDQTPSLPKTEVIRRLRTRGEPITFFGETDLEREKRLRQLEAMTPEADLQTGQQNDYQRSMKEISGEFDSDDREKKKKNSSKESAGPIDIESMFSDGGDNQRSREEICLLFFKKLVKLWEIEMAERPEAVKRSASGKTAAATVKQTKHYLRPLFKHLKKKNFARRYACIYI